MNGIEIMQVCKEQTDCEHCPAQVKKACKAWKQELLNLEPANLNIIVEDKEF